MATQVINGMKYVIETDADKAKHDIRSIADSSIAAQKRIDQAAQKTPFVESMSQYNTRMGMIGSFGAGISAFQQSASSLIGWKGGMLEIAHPIKDAMLSAGKNVSAMFKNNIITAGASAALTLAEELTRTMMRFQELETETLRPYFDVEEKELRDARWRGADEGQSKGTMHGAGIGALVGGTIGTIFGGPAGAVAGAAIGSGVGSWVGKIGGAILGSKEEEEAKRREIFNRNQAAMRMRIMDAQNRTLRNEQRMSDFGFQELMARSSGRQERIQLIKDKIEQINKGTGDNTISALRKKYYSMTEGEKATGEGQEVYRRLQSQLDRVDDLKMMLSKERLNPVTRMELPDTYADEYSRKGLYVGAQVDVRSVNEDILAQLKTTNDLLRKGFMEQRSEVGVFKEDVIMRN